MREHGAPDAIADGINVANLSLEVIVDLDPLLVIKGDSNLHGRSQRVHPSTLSHHLLQAKILSSGSATNRHKGDVGLKLQ